MRWVRPCHILTLGMVYQVFVCWLTSMGMARGSWVAFDHLPVHMLAGTVPIDKTNVLKAIRHGMGTPVLQKFSRKSYLSLSHQSLGIQT